MDEPAMKPAAQDSESDDEAYTARLFRDDWAAVWFRHYGSFDDITRLQPMRFTDEPAPGHGAFPMSTLQVFSVRVEGIRRGLQWPLHVFGVVAASDSIDFNRNLIFSRTRDNCQTLTKEDRDLALVGPTRAVAWQDFLRLDVELTVKGATESEDKQLSFLAIPFVCGHALHSYRFRRYKTSRLSTLGFALGRIELSVEATISVRVTEGSWPDGVRAQLAAFAAGVRRKGVAGTDRERIVLLDSGGGDPVPVASGGEIVLSRRVVSVETTGKLRVCVRARDASSSGIRGNVARDEVVFTPQKSSRSSGVLDVGFCRMDVTVAWSLTCDEIMFLLFPPYLSSLGVICCSFFDEIIGIVAVCSRGACYGTT